MRKMTVPACDHCGYDKGGQRTPMRRVDGTEDEQWCGLCVHRFTGWEAHEALRREFSEYARAVRADQEDQ